MQRFLSKNDKILDRCLNKKALRCSQLRCHVGFGFTLWGVNARERGSNAGSQV